MRILIVLLISLAYIAPWAFELRAQDSTQTANQTLNKNARQSLGRREFCQVSEFGVKKNLHFALLKLGVEIVDEDDFASVNLLKLFYDFYQTFPLSKQIKIVISEEKKSKNNTLYISPKWDDFLLDDDISKITSLFCSDKLQHLPKILPLSEGNLINQLLDKTYSYSELVQLVEKKWKLKLRSETTMKSFKLEQEMTKAELVRVLADIAYFPLKFINHSSLKYVTRLKSGYFLKSHESLEYDQDLKLAKFTDQYFSSFKSVLENKIFVKNYANIVWRGLTFKQRKRFWEFSWTRNGDIYKPKENRTMVNEIASRTIRDDFREHFVAFIINSTYLKNINNLKYLFFKNIIFEGYSYKEEKKEDKAIISKKKYVKDQVSFKFSKKTKRKSELSMITEIDSSKINLKDQIKWVEIIFDSSIKKKISKNFLISQSRLKIYHRLNLEGLSYGYNSIKELKIQTHRKLISIETQDLGLDLSFLKNNQNEQVQGTVEKTSTGGILHLKNIQSLKNLRFDLVGEDSRVISYLVSDKERAQFCGEINCKLEFHLHPYSKNQKYELRLYDVEHSKIQLDYSGGQKQYIANYLPQKLKRVMHGQDQVFELYFYNPKRLNISFLIENENNFYKLDTQKKLSLPSGLTLESTVQAKLTKVLLKLPKAFEDVKKIRATIHYPLSSNETAYQPQGIGDNTLGLTEIIDLSDSNQR